MDAIDVVGHALRVTALVVIMMIAVEYLNVVTRGLWARALSASRTRQYLVAVLLGASPGCLGAFAVVALYSHRMVTFGSLVAAMIATSGDESFVMLAMFPSTALWLMLGLAALGAATGVATDRVLGAGAGSAGHALELHEEENCDCFPRGRLLEQLREPSAARGALALATGLFLYAVVGGLAGPESWTWLRWTLLGMGAFTLFVVLTVPDHFLERHLWRHTVLQHAPRILLWTSGALLTVALARDVLPELSQSPGARWIALATAALLGLIPESGPHLLFVSLFDQGLVPLSTLVASSAVQDGHGMLPLLAHSRADFLKVKLINLAAGLAAGGGMMALGF